MKKGALLLCLIAGLCFLTTVAQATSYTSKLFTVEGDPLRVLLTVDDITAPGEITFDLRVAPDTTYPNTGDLRGFFFNIDVVPFPTLLGASSFTNISGGPVTDVVISNDNVSHAGAGNDIDPVGPYDVGIGIGQPGLKGGSDDFQSAIFSLDPQGEFDIFDLFGERDPFGHFFAANVTSVGLPSGDRQGNSVVVNPEPTTLLLLGSGLIGLGVFRRKLRKR